MKLIFKGYLCSLRPVNTVRALILVAALSGFLPIEARYVIFTGEMSFTPHCLAENEVTAEISRQKLPGSRDTDPDSIDPKPVKPDLKPVKPDPKPPKPDPKPPKPDPKPVKPDPKLVEPDPKPPKPNPGTGQTDQPSQPPVIRCSHCGQNHDVSACPQLKPPPLMCSHCGQDHKSEACPSRRIFKRAFLGVLGCLVVGSMAVIGFRVVQILRRS